MGANELRTLSQAEVYVSKTCALTQQGVRGRERRLWLCGQ